MSHVNTTPHYGLPIYGENDIINPLTDFNDANSAIDTALYEIADAQGSEASSISAINTFLGDKELDTVAQNVTDAINEVNTAVGNADTAIGNVAGDVATLQGAVGNSSTGLIHDVNELQTTVGSQGNSITALQGVVGNAESGLVKDVADLQRAEVANTKIASVTADGVKTWGALFNELYAALALVSSKINSTTKLTFNNQFFNLVISDGSKFMFSSVGNDDTTPNNLGISINYVTLKTTGSTLLSAYHYTGSTPSSGNNDFTSTVPTSGIEVSVYSVTN